MNNIKPKMESARSGKNPVNEEIIEKNSDVYYCYSETFGNIIFQ